MQGTVLKGRRADGDWNTGLASCKVEEVAEEEQFMNVLELTLNAMQSPDVNLI